MKVRNFIGASSALLIAWLGVTFLHDVPSDHYPSQLPSISKETSQTPSDTAAETVLVADKSQQDTSF